MAHITIQDVRKSYAKTEVVHGVSLEVQSGEFVVILGPSGCGKSTLLRMIAGLESISAGEISIAGKVVNDLEPHERGCAMVFQNYALYPHMTVADNIGYGLKVAGLPRAERAAKVAAVAASVGLTEFLDRRPGQLSGGQRQRVAMARAIVREPAVFLFDEPLSNLDAKLRGQMRAEIKKLHQKVKTTVVYVTHDQVEAMTLADRIVVMKDGHIEQVGTPMEVFNHPVTTFVATFIGSPPMNLLPGTITGQTVRLADGTEVPVPDRLREYVRDGMAVQLGIRPDDISPVGHGLSQDGPGAEVALTVDLAEPLGMESLIYTRLAGQEVQAKLYGPRIVAPGEVLTFRLALDRAHLFDAATGKSVRVL